MKRIIKITILFYCCCLAQTAIGQFLIPLKDNAIDVKPVGFHIAEVKDGRLQKNGLGTIIIPTNDKATITIAGGVKNGLQNFWI